MTKAVFFDWDGTLVDSLPLLFKAHNHVREKFGVPAWSRAEYAEQIVYSTRELYPRIYGARAQEGMDLLYEYITANHIEQMSLLDGAEAVLSFLKERGVPMGLVSNKRDDVLRREVEHLGWQKYFDVYIGAGVAPRDKPSGAPLIHALGLHAGNLKINDILYVGDTESDLACARDAGCAVAFIVHPPRRDDLIGRYRPDYVVESLGELKHSLMDYLGKDAEIPT